MHGRTDGVPTPTPAVRVLTAPCAPVPRDEALKARLLAALARDQGWPRWGPARWSYGNLRRELGGRVVSAHFRRLVDGLIAEGLVVEIREPARNGGWRQHRHVVVRVHQGRESRWGVLVGVRGRGDVPGWGDMSSRSRSAASEPPGDPTGRTDDGMTDDTANGVQPGRGKGAGGVCPRGAAR